MLTPCCSTLPSGKVCCFACALQGQMVVDRLNDDVTFSVDLTPPPPSSVIRLRPCMISSTPPSLISSLPHSLPASLIACLPSFLPSLRYIISPSFLPSVPPPSCLSSILPSLLPSLRYPLPSSSLPRFPPSFLPSFPNQISSSKRVPRQPRVQRRPTDLAAELLAVHQVAEELPSRRGFEEPDVHLGRGRLSE